MPNYQPNSDIITLDALYHEPELASIHLLLSNNRVAIVDTGTVFSVPHVVAKLSELGLGVEAVDLIILTHIHLDHAGGAGELMRLCDNATLVVHPRGARHMVDPSKLIAGASAVYGESEFNALYGTIVPIDADRILQPQDGDALDFAGRELRFFDTPGHASHHHCILDTQTNSVFTGDTLGIAYRALRNGEQSFLMPTTTPVQFDPQALHSSIDKVMSLQPETLYLTHYGAIQPTSAQIAGLHEQIDDYVMLTQQAADAGDDFEHALADSLKDYLVQRCMNQVAGLDEAVVRHWVKLDAELNAQGLHFWWHHRRVA
ncbi:MBL fold metallo-hydrolase [Arenicella xantha]|uniref:Metallo-beta-lactamase superfamily protein n=1 Tax=Arenicella xantha TaxID=644221 RepID=A0A395JFW8_9GAMM|nr:MBL fold metallo-hydrolase [Arenicella xantha]RBP48693.1 metallo-beta-lactamase superfamily protein [Arenicella xantha]